MEVDYLIIGQGISGTMLALALMDARKRVLVIDDAQPYTASKIASGLINPVTGKKFVTTWMADELLEASLLRYRQLENQFAERLIHQYDLLNFHPTQEASSLFESRELVDDTYLNYVNDTTEFSRFFHFQFGIGEVSPCYIVDVPKLLHLCRQFFLANHVLEEKRFSFSDFQVGPGGIMYQNILAGKVIFCQGADDIANPYFTRLNFQLNKGEAIIAHIPDLPSRHIYKFGPISLVPLQEDRFWVGSTFDREYEDAAPTPAFRKLIEATLSNWLKLPYTMEQQFSALRPATGGQKPFIGMHPIHSRLGIFNGMGSKGCSLTPYFAKEFVQHLEHGTPLTPEVDILRYAKILSR